jgi:hypothetical protein
MCPNDKGPFRQSLDRPFSNPKHVSEMKFNLIKDMSKKQNEQATCPTELAQAQHCPLDLDMLLNEASDFAETA